jgi:hypothetical protein
MRDRRLSDAGLLSRPILLLIRRRWRLDEQAAESELTYGRIPQDSEESGDVTERAILR